MCGFDEGVKDFAYTYFTLKLNATAPENWTAASRSNLHAVCTQSCPSAAQGLKALARSPGKCPDGDTDYCTWYGASTVQVGKYCMDPRVFEVEIPWEEWLRDIRSAKFHLLLVLPIAVLVGFVYLNMMERCGTLFVWISLLTSAVLPLLLGLWLYHSAKGKDKGTEKTVAFGLWALSGLILLFACCYRKTIQSIIAVVTVTSQFLKEVPSQMIQPMIFGVMHMVVIACWLVIFVLVASVGAKDGALEPGTSAQECLENKDMFCVKWDTRTTSMLLVFLLLMLYWLLNFLHAVSHFGTAFAVTAWYFTLEDHNTGVRIPEEGGATLCDMRLSVISVKYGLRHHSGSLAFGSFCIGCAKVIKLLLFWVTKDEEARPSNPCVKCLLRIANCLADCFTRCIEFVSEHAYAEMAIKGEAFCSSAKYALKLSVKHAVLFTLVGRVATAVRFLGVVLISTLGTSAVAATLTWLKPESLHSIAAPVVCAAVCSFTIAEVMMHPFAAAARACLHCYCFDDEQSRAKGVSNAEHTPQPMMRFVENHSVAHE
jgi:hypothetical protein